MSENQEQENQQQADQQSQENYQEENPTQEVQQVNDVQQEQNQEEYHDQQEPEGQQQDYEAQPQYEEPVYNNQENEQVYEQVVTEQPYEEQAQEQAPENNEQQPEQPYEQPTEQYAEQQLEQYYQEQAPEQVCEQQQDPVPEQQAEQPQEHYPEYIAEQQYEQQPEQYQQEYPAEYQPEQVAEHDEQQQEQQVYPDVEAKADDYAVHEAEYIPEPYNVEQREEVVVEYNQPVVADLNYVEDKNNDNKQEEPYAEELQQEQPIEQQQPTEPVEDKPVEAAPYPQPEEKKAQNVVKAVSLPPVNAQLKSRTFNFVLLGDSNTGKTSIAHYWNHNTYVQNVSPTTGVDTYLKQFGSNKFNVKLNIIDTAGYEKYRATTTTTLRRAEFVGFVFSHDDETSFDNVKKWFYDARYVNADFIPILIGNKADLEAHVQESKIDELKAKLNIGHYYSISCKNGSGVLQILAELNYEDAKIFEQPYQLQKIEPVYVQKEYKKEGCC